MPLKASSPVPSKTVLRYLCNITLAGTATVGAVFMEHKRRSVREWNWKAQNSTSLRSHARYSSCAAAGRIKELLSQARVDEAETELAEFETSMSHHSSRETVATVVHNLRCKVLRTLWWASKDIKQLTATFNKLESRFDLFRPLPDLFEHMANACLHVHNEDGANYYLQQMSIEYGFEPTVFSVGLVLLGHAHRDQWEVVYSGLEDLRKFRERADYESKFRRIFNAILVEYLRHHGPERAQKFCFKAIDRYGLVPNQYTSNLIVSRLAHEGQAEQLRDFLTAMKPFGVSLDANSFRRLLQSHWLKDPRTPETQNSYYLVALVNELDPSLVSGSCRRILNQWNRRQPEKRTDNPALSDATRRPRQDEASGHRRGGLDVRDDVMSLIWTDGTPGMMLRRVMRRELHTRGGPEKVIRAFKKAQADGISLRQQVVREAVAAALKLEGRGSPEVGSLLESLGSPNNFPTALLPVIYSQLDRVADNDTVYETPFYCYDLLERAHEPIVHTVTRRAAKILMDRGKAAMAVQLMVTAGKSRWAKLRPFNLVCFNVLLQAYWIRRDVDGIWDVVKAVLEREFTIDKVFEGCLRGIVRDLGRRVAALSSRKLRFLLRIVLDRRAEQRAEVRQRFLATFDSVAGVPELEERGSGPRSAVDKTRTHRRTQPKPTPKRPPARPPAAAAVSPPVSAAAASAPVSSAPVSPGSKSPVAKADACNRESKGVRWVFLAERTDKGFRASGRKSKPLNKL
ncbi:MAG: hypothetical protein M1815_005518 [Lichina confinis]|nr:MAG: hypothetical protein M1815_005518 [Lichina confinis]